MAEQPTGEQPPPSFLKDLFQLRYPEATLQAVVVGTVFGGLMNMAITYAGLKIGFTIVGSAIAAVVGFGVLKGLLGRGTILEVNIVQTIGSAVNVPSGGIIFTVPALFLLGFTLQPEQFWLVVLAASAGALLGVAIIVPLRKQMVEIDRLRFPSGVAVAAILKSPGAGAKKSIVLLWGILVAVLITLPVELPNIKIGEGKEKTPLPGYSWLDIRLSDPRTDPKEPLPRSHDRNRDGRPDLLVTDKEVDVGRAVGLPDSLLLVFAITPLSFGAGYLTGGAGLMVLAGGVLAFFLLNPIAYHLGWMPASLYPDQVPGFGYSNFNRPLGIGLLLGGALMGIVAALPAIRAALGSLTRAAPGKGDRDELSLKFLFTVIGPCVLALFLATEVLGDHGAAGGLLGGLNSHLRHAIIALIGAAWIWFAAIIISQCTGMTDWSPISGMALLTVVLVMTLAGTQQVVLAVLLGAALCVACSGASDMMTDLKTGHLVGASPKRQQVVELIGVFLGPVISMSTLLLIVAINQTNYGVPLGPGTDTTAPQAQALEAVIRGVGGGEMPYLLYGCGAVLGLLLGLGAFPGLGVLVGLSMYLPITYTLTYGLGCLANILVRRLRGRAWAEEWGVPFCAGLIVGEAFLAMIVNIIVLLRG